MGRLATTTASILFTCAAAAGSCTGRHPVARDSAVWLECAAVELDLSGTTVLIDPWFPFAREADAVLVTHLHYDHFSPGTIARLQEASGERLGLIVGPRQIAVPLREIGRGKERIAGAGETIRFRNLEIKTVPATEDGRDDLGYLVRDERTGLSVLHLGDNRSYSEKYAGIQGIDYLFLSMGKMPLPDMLRLLESVRPRFLVPIHYKPPEGAFQTEFYPSPARPQEYLADLARAIEDRGLDTRLKIVPPARPFSLPSATD